MTSAATLTLFPVPAIDPDGLRYAADLLDIIDQEAIVPEPTAPEPVYPLPSPPEDDPRFTHGLIFDVVNVLEAAGYPAFTGADIVRLQQALFGVLYSPGD